MAVDYASATIEYGATPTSMTLLELTKKLAGIVDNSQDDDLTLYLQMAGEAAEQWIDNKLVMQAVTENYAASKSPVALRFYPASDLTLVEIDAVDVTTDWELMTSDGITWTLNNRNSASRTDYFNQMVIGYSAGFDPLPAEVGFAIAQIAIGYDESGGSAVGSVKKEVVNGVGSVEYVTGTDSDGSVGVIAPATIRTLEKYRRYHV